MISIIICSRTQTISSVLQENIINTIGCEYELIVIDNSENKYSIFEAYNIGIEKSKGEYLCFMHDDINIHTNGWGNVLNYIFNNDSKIGLIGIAGSKIKTKMPSAWWDCPEEQIVIHIIQHFPNKAIEKWEIGFKDDLIIEVVAIDGVFMAMRRDDRIKFDERLKGFHNYDLNISFEYKKSGYKILVTKEILLEHYSLGTIGKEWVQSTYEIHNLYKNILPLRSLKKEIIRVTEISNAKRFINECLKYNNNKLAFIVWSNLFWLNPISKFHLNFFKIILFIK